MNHFSLCKPLLTLKASPHLAVSYQWYLVSVSVGTLGAQQMKHIPEKATKLHAVRHVWPDELS